MRFAEEIGAAWNKDPAQFNEHYFKETAALAIIFHAVEKIISAQSWYKNSYRANIVTYSLSIFHHAVKKRFSDDELNLLAVWKAQQMPPDFEKIFASIKILSMRKRNLPPKHNGRVLRWTQRPKSYRSAVRRGKKFTPTPQHEN